MAPHIPTPSGYVLEITYIVEARTTHLIIADERMAMCGLRVPTFQRRHEALTPDLEHNLCEKCAYGMAMLRDKLSHEGIRI